MEKKFYNNNKDGFNLSVKEMLNVLNGMYSYYCSLDRDEYEEKFRIALKFAIHKIELHNYKNELNRQQRLKNKSLSRKT